MHIPDILQTSDLAIIATAEAEAAQLRGGEPAAASPPPQIPGYDLIAQIGQGGQGVVFEAVQSATGRRVAVKVMRGGPAAGSERRHRFEREIRLLARLRHPALVAVHDSGEADGWFYLVMEFVEGTPIDEFVDASALARRESLELFARVCDAVHAAHQRGVIHRDLKPANILVDDAGRPHVLDFGLAKLTPESEGATGVTNDGRVLGTMAWASPEQASGRTDDIDTRTDIYSLGVVLYELMTGRLPYETSGSIREALDNIAESPPTPPRRLDPTLRGDIETIALKCLAKERDRRYSTVAEVAADIRRSLAGEAIDARRDSRLYVMLRTLRRYRVPVSVGVACMLSGTAFGTVMTGMYRQEATQHQQAVRQVEELTEELKQLRAALVSPANWRTTFDSGDKLLRMDPDEALDLIRSAWAEAAGDVSARQQMLKAANVAELPRFVPIMDLGMRDPDAEVQVWAISTLRRESLRDFSLDFGAYEAWYERSRDLTLTELRTRTAREFIEEVRQTAPADRAALFGEGRPGALLAGSRAVAAAAGELGLQDLIIESLGTSTDRDTIRAIGGVLTDMGLDEAFLREHIVPLIRHENDGIANEAVQILARQKAVYAVDEILSLLEDRVREGTPASASPLIAGALGEIGDTRAIPSMIAMIDAARPDGTVYDIGYFGLGKLTGVMYDESHDGAWWRDWWEKNRQRFPLIADREIPEIEPRKASGRDPDAPAPTAPDTAASEEAPEQSLLAGGDLKMRYFLYGPKDADTEGARPLLLVMPGGDGGADFAPFVTNIWRQTATEQMMVAQLVAPRWSADQFDTVVWPTNGLGWEGARFTTERFVSAVVDDIDARYDIDRSRVWLLAWSSGGPAAYASLLDGPATGAFVAMSVFKPDQLGDLSKAAGKGVYILHSPEDFIPMSFPSNARDDLAGAGARTVLETYDGGHGWHGDVFGMLRKGLAWLEEQAAER